MDAPMVLKAAASTYRGHPRLVVGLAVSVFGIAAVVDTLAHAIAHSAIEGKGLTVLAIALAGPVSASTTALVFFAGVLDRLVSHHLFGHDKPTLVQTFRTLRWLRLLVADAVHMSFVGIGWVLGAVPGLLMFTLWCLIGSVINIEGATVLGALRRSARLVRPRFWLAFVLVTLPATVESVVLHSLHFGGANRPLLAAFAISAVIGVSAGAVIGLVEVALAHLLISEERGTSLTPIKGLS
ncbi:MAG: hypothetical protein ACRDJ2_15330 [Actinomycetota bacterium]